MIRTQTPQIEMYPPELFDEPPSKGERRQWWVVCTRPRQEKALARDLTQREISYYLPLVARTRLIRGRRVVSHVPLFGGYVFVHGDDSERIRSLKTQRVAYTLEVDDQYQFASELRSVHQMIESGADLTVEQRLRPGHRVRVKTGPLEGLEGQIICRRGESRLLVAIHLLHQGVSLSIEDFLVEPI